VLDVVYMYVRIVWVVRGKEKLWKEREALVVNEVGYSEDETTHGFF